jgi:hypothetical protein
VAFEVWLGIGVLALVVANIKIWVTSRALSRVQQQLVQPNSSVPSRAIAELTGSVIAR